MKKTILTLIAVTTFGMSESMACKNSIETMVTTFKKAKLYSKHGNEFNTKLYLMTSRDYAIEVLVDCQDNKNAIKSAGDIIALANKFGV